MADQPVAPAVADTVTPPPPAPLGTVDQTQPLTPEVQADPPSATPPVAKEPAEPFDGPDWLKEFPKEVRDDKSLWKYTSLESGVRGMSNAQRIIGGKLMAVPKTDEDWANVYDQLGRPKEAKDYAFPEVKLPEGMTYDTALEGNIRAAFHIAGLNPKQAQILRDAYVAAKVGEFDSSLVENKIDFENKSLELKRELGSNYDKYVNAAGIAQKEFLSPDLVEAVKAAGLDKHPAWIKDFGRVGIELKGDDWLKAAGAAAVRSPGEIQMQIAEFRAKNQDALFDRTHPDNARLVNELTRMTEQAYPSQPAS